MNNRGGITVVLTPNVTFPGETTLGQYRIVKSIDKWFPVSHAFLPAIYFPITDLHGIMSDMLMLLVSISTTLLCFLSAAACLRFLFSRQGWFWVLPLAISIAFLAISISPLYGIATGMIAGSYRVEISPDTSVREIIPLLIVLLWYTMIITFRYALKLVVPDNRHLINTVRNMNEAQYMQRIELRRFHRESRKQQRKQVRVQKEHGGSRYPIQWVALFDDQK
jgi:hypothetical protein